jgi:hypothetical protein
MRSYLKPGERQSKSADEAMQGLLKALKFDPRMFAVFEVWDRETKGWIRGCEAVAIQGNRLCVLVPSAAHRQELIYSKQKLLDRLNQALGKHVIRDIHFELVSS